MSLRRWPCRGRSYVPRAVWPTSFALKRLTSAEEKKIGALVKKAVS
jgi:hypothetical protein